MSTLCHQSCLRRDLPPWQIIIVHGVGSNMEEKTWVVLRAHQLLTTSSILPGMEVKTYIDPWQAGHSKSIPLLDAPIATTRLLEMLLKQLRPTISKGLSTLRAFIYLLIRDITDFVKTVAPAFHSKLSEEFHYVYVEQKYVISFLMTLCLLIRSPAIIFRLISEINKFNTRNKWRDLFLNFIQTINKISEWSLLKSYQNIRTVIHNIASCIWRALMWSIKIWKERTPNEQLVIDAFFEIYWIIRAFVSVPRLLLEELIETRRSKPLYVWKGYRRPESQRIAWNDGISMQLFRSVQAATGASLPSVLLTSATGAVRNLLRSSNISLPYILRCTVPVCTSNGETISAVPSLMPLSLPTGIINPSDSLDEVRKSLRKIRFYPEKYLISSWIFKNISLLASQSTLAWMTEKLTGNYPILVTYITAPAQSATLWDLKISGMYYLRQPVHQAGEKKNRTLI